LVTFGYKIALMFSTKVLFHTAEEGTIALDG